MALFQPFAPGIEVSGFAILSILDGFSVLRSIPTRIMLDQGLGQIDQQGQWVLDRTAWYPQRAWLAALATLFEKFGEGVLFQIGQKIPANAVFPPAINDIHSSIRAANVAYHKNHRKHGVVMFDAATGQFLDGIGHYGYEPITGRNEILVDCKLPYPTSYAQGVLTTLARKFESRATVELDLTLRPSPQEVGRCAFRIRW